MLDILYIVATAGFFVLAAIFGHALERISGERESAAPDQQRGRR